MKYFDDYPDILSVQEIQQVLRIGKRQAYELVKSETFKEIRIPESRFFSKKQLIKWLSGEI